MSNSKSMRKRLYEIIEAAENNDTASKMYDRFMIFVIIVSIVPMLFKEANTFFLAIEYITISVFIIDYILRFITADFKLHRNSVLAFIMYPFTPFAIIDVISILPVLLPINNGFKLLRLLRLGKSLKTFKLLRYSKSFVMIINVINKQKKSLLSVCYIAFGYVFLSALIMYSVEPESFANFFYAVYWSVVTLTTVGYGDIYPVSVIGRIVSMVSSFMGIAIVAMPTGIITAGFTSELEKQHNQKEDN